MSEKRNWIFLRGLTRGNIHWGDFPGVFQSMHPDDEVEFLEIPGNGLLFNELTPVDPETLVKLLSFRSRFIKEGQKVHLCGISLGGMVALKWAELLPSQVLSVTIINCSLKQFSSFYQRLNPTYYRKIISTLFSNNALIQEQVVLSITSNRAEKYDRYLHKFAEFSKHHPVTKKNFFNQLLLASRIKISSLHVPLKVISAINDRLVSQICSSEIAVNLKGKLVIHPMAGHDLPLDEPEWLAQQL